MKLIHNLIDWLHEWSVRKRNAIVMLKAAQIEQRITHIILDGAKPFTPDELVYSSHEKCMRCKSGLAFPWGAGRDGYWMCSGLLTGEQKVTGTEDTKWDGPKKSRGQLEGHSVLPFSHWNIMSERHSRANGATTRPKVAS